MSAVPAAQSIRRNLALDVAVAISVAVTGSAAGLIPTMARQAGLVPLGLALIAAAPFVGNLLGAFAGRFGPQEIRGYGALRVGTALLLLLIAVAPNPLLIMLGIGIFQLAVSFGSPFQTRLWGALYPADVRSKVLGTLGTTRAATGAVAAIAVGVIADRAGMLPAVMLAGLVGAAFALAAFGLRSGRPLPVRRYTAREAVSALTTRPELSRLVLAQGFYGTGLIASFPLYALVNVDRLHLSIAQVGTLGVIGGLATMISYPAWGSLVDRFGYRLGLRAGAAFGVASIACVAVAPGYLVLALGSVAGGLSGAGMDLGIQGAMAATTPLADRAAAMAGWNSVTGARGVVAPLLATALVQAGIVDVTGALLLCLAPATLGMAMYCGLPVPSPRAVVRAVTARGRSDGARPAVP